MATYPDKAYVTVMDYYKHLSEELKPKANEVLSNFAKRYQQGEAPPEEMLSSLKALASKKEGGLESRLHQGQEGALPQLFEGVGRFFSNPVAIGDTALLLLYFGLPLYQPL